tara:strand:- start:3729 stop:5369 length:1641 start_codon:yes stop_codon:yes gene_type:complete
MNKKEMICYDTDASQIEGKAEKVVFPENLERVQNILKTANLDVVVRGGGTSLLGGAIANNSIVVDMNKMNKIINFDKNKDLVYVQAGISIKELNEKLNSIGFEFPFYPINQASTLGGMISRNISSSRMKYGKVKDWIEEIEFVNGRGELMKTSKSDLGDIAGLEGITGIIVNIRLKTKQLSKKSISVFQSDSLDEILSISRRLKLEKDVIMLEVFPKEVSEMVGLPRKYNLVVEFDSERGKIIGEEYKRISNLRKKLYYTMINKSYFNVEDGKFFFDKLKEFVLYLENNQIPYIGYLGSGIIYYFFTDEEDNKRKQVVDLMRKMGGKFISGIGLKRKQYVDDFEKKILQRVKLRHDPFGKLNKGKIIDFEAKISTGRHLDPLDKGEIEEIKPLLEIEKVSFEPKKIQTPEEKMGEFIEKVEVLEKTKPIEEQKLEPKQEKKQNPFSTQALIEDYAQTYDSELEEDRRKNIEQFARNVAHEVSSLKQELESKSITPKEQSYEEDKINNIKSDEIKEQEFKIDDPNVEKRGKLTKEDEDEVNRVIFGG